MERPRLADSVSDSLIEMIAAGELRPNDALPSEADLAERFNVSKPTVRESLKQLALFGMVEIKQGKVARVRTLDSSALEGFFRLAVRSSDSGFRDALELRRAIEIEIAELAAARATQSAIREIEAAYQVMANSLDSLDPWLEGDFAFHMALARASQNTIMLNVIDGLSGVVRYTMRVFGAQSDLRDARATLARHRGILDAIISHDTAAASSAMRQHFDATRPFISAIAGDRSRLARM